MLRVSIRVSLTRWQHKKSTCPLNGWQMLELEPNNGIHGIVSTLCVVENKLRLALEIQWGSSRNGKIGWKSGKWSSARSQQTLVPCDQRPILSRYCHILWVLSATPVHWSRQGANLRSLLHRPVHIGGRHFTLYGGRTFRYKIVQYYNSRPSQVA